MRYRKLKAFVCVKWSEVSTRLSYQCVYFTFLAQISKNSVTIVFCAKFFIHCHTFGYCEANLQCISFSYWDIIFIIITRKTIQTSMCSFTITKINLSTVLKRWLLILGGVQLYQMLTLYWNMIYNFKNSALMHQFHESNEHY